MKTVSKLVLYDDELVRLETVKNFIEQNFNEDITVKRLSEKFSISISTLQRHFEVCTGEPISQYLHKCRMFKAMFLLTTHSMPISQIGMAVGYNHRSAFTHAFAKFFGNPPSYFLRRLS